jgi:transcriptional regulator
MPSPERYKNRIDLLQGTLDLIVLQTLRRGPQHGYGISQAINAASREAFKIETGSLYPALHRLERQGWIASEWKTSENKQRAKYYRLTAAGRKQLTSERSRWGQFVEAMASLMAPRDHEA